MLVKCYVYVKYVFFTSLIYMYTNSYNDLVIMKKWVWFKETLSKEARF